MEHLSRALYVRWNGLLKVVHCSCGYCEVFLSNRKAHYAFLNHRGWHDTDPFWNEDLKEAGA